MYQTLLGRDGFRKGMDLYFQRHDGQAVTCDDFRAAMADANGRRLDQFERWYSQAGTPRVTVATRHDPEAGTYDITLSQSCPPTPGQKTKLPFHIPVKVGLLAASGADLPLQLDGEDAADAPATRVLELTEASQTFRFAGIADQPVPSLLRDFSAPVILEYDYSDEELAFLMAHDSDPFNRWEAGQRLATRRLLALTRMVQEQQPMRESTASLETYTAVLHKTLNDATLDPSFREMVLTLPSEGVLAEQMDVIAPQEIHTARQFARRLLARTLRNELVQIVDLNQTPGDYSPDALSAGKRGLKNVALLYLAELDDTDTHAMAQAQYDKASNMTDRIAALSALQNSSAPGRRDALERFYTEFEDEPLVIDKWFTLQATSPATDVAAVRALMKHPAFTIKNPNRARSLIFSFCNGNPSRFHAADGCGYQFWAEQVIALDAINPQVSARLARTMDRWRKYAPALQSQMQAALQSVASTPRLSKDLSEVITKSLATD
jgi:aminopeptidase N